MKARVWTKEEDLFLRENCREFTRSKLSKHLNCHIGIVSRKLRDLGLITYVVWMGKNSEELYYREEGLKESRVFFTKQGKDYILDMLLNNKKDPKQISEIIGLKCPKPVIRCLKTLGVDMMGEYLKRKGVWMVCKGCGDEFKVKPSRKSRSKFCLRVCSDKWKIPKEKIICIECGAEKKVRRYRREITKFCSNKCKYKSEDWRSQIREIRSRIVFPVKDTSIEVKIQGFLKKLGIEFFTHQYMNIEHSYQCDILIPSRNLVIECDGDYWHGNQNSPRNVHLTERQIKQKERDGIRTEELIARGFLVLRLWECEINSMDVLEFQERLYNLN